MNATINNRVALARELAEVFSHSLITVHHGNGEIVDLLFGGNDEESPLLLGESAEAIRANLERVLELASQPTPVAIGGRNRTIYPLAISETKHHIWRDWCTCG